MNGWIADWKQISDSGSYIVAAVNSRGDGSLYIGGSLPIMTGWQVKRLTERCYVAMETPPFDPAIIKENTSDHSGRKAVSVDRH